VFIHLDLSPPTWLHANFTAGEKAHERTKPYDDVLICVYVVCGFPMELQKRYPITTAVLHSALYVELEYDIDTLSDSLKKDPLLSPFLN